MRTLVLAVFYLLATTAYAQQPDIDSLINQARDAEADEKVRIYSDISYYAGFSDTELATEYARKCIGAAKQTGDSILIAEGYNAMAIALYMKSDYAGSLEFNRKALAIRLVYGDDYSLLSSYSKIGNCLHELGRYDEAIGYYLKSLRISEENNLTQQTGLLSNNIAEIFKQQENYEKAFEYYDISIGISKQLNDTLGLCKALINKGVAYKRQKRFADADSLYTKAYSLIEGKKLYDVKGGLLINFGVLYKEWAQPEKSIPYYRRAEELYKQSGEMHGLSIVYSNLGNSFLETGRPDQALTYYRKGISLAEATGSLPRMVNAYEGLTNYYREKGDFMNAFRNDSMTDALRDSLFDIEKSRIIQELNTQYQTEKKEKQLAEKETVLARQEIKIQHRNIQLLGALGGLALILLLSVFVYRNQKNKQEKLRQQVALEKAETINRIQDEKLRISRDLHDNIGSQLTFVISSLDNLNYIKNDNQRRDRLSRLSRFTRETMTQLRETIWALNSENITLEQLAMRMAEFINHARLAYPGVNFRIESDPAAKSLKSKQAINLYRTLQEAVNNAVRHSEAENITFSVVGSRLSVSDDGKGFDMSSGVNGHGLDNIRKRTEEAGLKSEIHSRPGKGTEVTILV